MNDDEHQAANPGHGGGKDGGGHGHNISAAVVTTSGSYPGHGFESVPEEELVQKFLAEASGALHLTDTTGWIANAAGQPVDPAKSFKANGLGDKTKVHWGPREGGGGC